MTIPFYCINLDKDIARRKRMESEVQKMPGFSLIRVPAVLGKDVSFSEKEKYFAPDYLKTVKDGEVGCLLSHYGIWKGLLDTNEKYRIILEDDVSFSDDFSERLKGVLGKVNNFDIIYLGCGGVCGNGCKKLGKNRCPTTDIPGFARAHHAFGAYGYVISKRGANKLVNLVQKRLSAPFDAEMGDPNLFDIFCFTPAIITEGYGSDKSNISIRQYGWIPGISLSSPVGKMPGSYPLNFYFNMMGLILVIVCVYLALARIKINHFLLFGILFFINFLDFFIGNLGWSDMRTVLSALFNTIVPFFLYLIIFNFKTK